MTNKKEIQHLPLFVRQRQVQLVETTDVITGEVFNARTENHYEKNDGIPVAPPVKTPRLSLRERIERMLYTPVDPNFGQYDDNDADWDDEGDDPLTPDEQRYVEQNAAIEKFEAARIARENASRQPKDDPAPTLADPPSDGPSTRPKPDKLDASPLPSKEPVS